MIQVIYPAFLTSHEIINLMCFMSQWKAKEMATKILAFEKAFFHYFSVLINGRKLSFN